MSRRVMISPGHLWTRKLRQVSADAQRVAFFVATCDARTGEGIYRLPAVRIGMELGGMPIDDVYAALEELEKAGLVRFDDDAEIVWWINGLADQPIGSAGPPSKPNSTIVNAVKLIADLPQSPLIEKFAQAACAEAPALAEALARSIPELTPVIHERLSYLAFDEEPPDDDDLPRTCARCDDPLKGASHITIGGEQICPGCLPADEPIDQHGSEPTSAAVGF